MTAHAKRNPYRIVNRPHQYRILGFILLYNLCLTVFLAFVFLLPDVLTIYDRTLSIEIRAMASERILTIHSRTWPTVIAIICFICLHSVRVFNRSVGPIYRFTVAFREARDGNLGYHVILRNKDHLHKEASAYNEMLGALGEKIAAVQAAGQDGLRMMEKVESGIRKTGSPAGTHAGNIAGLRKCLEDIVFSAGYFRTQRPDIETTRPVPSKEILELTSDDRNRFPRGSRSAPDTALGGNSPGAAGPC